MSSPALLSDALAPICRAIELDGYVTHHEVDGDTLIFSVEPGSDACEDCLSPKPVLNRMLEQTLAKADLHMAVHINYPGEAARGQQFRRSS